MLKWFTGCDVGKDKASFVCLCVKENQVVSMFVLDGRVGVYHEGWDKEMAWILGVLKEFCVAGQESELHVAIEAMSVRRGDTPAKQGAVLQVMQHVGAIQGVFVCDPLSIFDSIHVPEANDWTCGVTKTQRRNRIERDFPWGSDSSWRKIMDAGNKLIVADRYDALGLALWAWANHEGKTEVPRWVRKIASK